MTTRAYDRHTTATHASVRKQPRQSSRNPVRVGDGCHAGFTAVYQFL